MTGVSADKRALGRVEKPRKRRTSKSVQIRDALTRRVRVVVEGKPRKMTVEEVNLRQLILHALGNKEFLAIKLLLEIFDDCFALPFNTPKAHWVLTIPADYDFQDTCEKLRLYGPKLPKGVTFKLSRIGERRLAERRRRQWTVQQAIHAYEMAGQECDSAIANYDAGVVELDKRDPCDERAFEEQDRLSDGMFSAMFKYLDAYKNMMSKLGFKEPYPYPFPGSVREPGVGYGTPPKATRFKKGTSGNPKGRPKADRSRKKMVQNLAAELRTVTEDGRESLKPTVVIALDILGTLGMKGELRAVKLHREYLKKCDPTPPEGGFGQLVVPGRVTVDEYMELLEEHRLKSEEDIAQRRTMLK